MIRKDCLKGHSRRCKRLKFEVRRYAHRNLKFNIYMIHYTVSMPFLIAQVVSVVGSSVLG